MKFFFFFLFIVATALLYSCGSVNKMDLYKKESRIPVLGTFVAYKNGDTLWGKRIRVKINNKDYQDDILLDGKLVERAGLTNWQNSKIFSENGNIRILNGKKSLYHRTERVSRISFFYTGGVMSSSPFTTTFTLQMKHEDGRMETVTYNSLLTALKNCPAALKKLEKDTDFASVRKKPEWAFSHLGVPVADVLKIYNDNCN